MKCAIEINLPCLALPCLEAISILNSLFYVSLLHITFLKLSVFFFFGLTNF